MAANEGLGYRPELDALRTVAAAAVFVRHANPSWLAGGGWVGVGAFFTLSGYLITRLLLIEQDLTGRINIPAFYVRRFRRLMPALAVALLGVVAIAYTIGDPGRLKGLPWAATYLGNLPSQADMDQLGHTWTLAVEENFYLLWPLTLLVLLKRVPARRLGLAVLGLALASAAWRYWLTFDGADFERLQRRSDVRAEGLLIGCALAVAIEQGARVWIPRVVPAAVLVWLAFVEPIDNDSVSSFGYTAVAVATAALIASWDARPTRAWRPLAWFGKYTYAFYLWHLPIIVVIYAHGPTYRLIVGGALSVGAAVASWHLVERWFVRRRGSERMMEAVPS